MPTWYLATIVAGCMFLLAASPTMAQSGHPTNGGISDAAAQQIAAMMQEKMSRTPAERKINSALLLTIKRHRGDALFAAVPSLRTAVEVSNDGFVLVDLRAIVSQQLLDAIEASGGTVVSSHEKYGAVRARISLAAVHSLASRADVRNIRPADRASTNKVDTSEGDVTHAADTGRTSFGVDGTGVKVGVLSDSVDALATLQASGDLPMNVTVLSGQSGNPGSSEGTAMLEIVYDLAPGADLYFATAFGGMATFAQNILDLQAAGCDVIVDDVFYFAEGVFQDDIIADAVDTVKAAGVQYYSSAGNSGNLNDMQSGVWEGDFLAGTTPPVLVGSGTAHDFDGGDVGNQITSDSPSFFILQWSDALGSSGNDYDLYMLDASMSTVLGAGNDFQDGDDWPVEGIDSQSSNDQGNVLVVLKWSGNDRMLHLNTNRGRLEHGTDGQTAGHAAARGAFGVAAVDWWETQTTGNPNPFDGSESVETFSSDGPRRVHYLANGTPITPGNYSSTGGELRQKPDIAAADGVSTATPGFNPFFGTSAAAPHAAAIGALMLDLDPTLTPDQARSIFNDTALDIEAPGFDRDSGAGIIMADDVLGAMSEGIFADGFESGNTSAWTDTVVD